MSYRTLNKGEIIELGDDPGPPRKLRFDEVASGGEEGPWAEKEISAAVEALPHALGFLSQ